MGVTKSLVNVKGRYVMIFKKNNVRKKAKQKIEEEIRDRKWKEENEEYLKELQRFFDKVEKIDDVDLRDNILNQMLQCDKVLTEVAEATFEKYYEIGLNKSKYE